MLLHSVICVFDCVCSCCSFCTPEVSGRQLSERLLLLQQPVLHTWSVITQHHRINTDHGVMEMMLRLFLYISFTAKGKYAGGNPVCPRPTPTWQKGIGDFFGGPPRKPEKENQRPLEVEDDEEAGGSGMSKASRKYVVLHCSSGCQVQRWSSNTQTCCFANSWLFSQLISSVVKWQKVKLQNQFSFNKQSDASWMLNRKPPLNEFVLSSSLNSLNMQLAPCRLLFYAIFASLFLMLIDLRLHWLLACEKKNEPLMSVCLCVSRFLNRRKAAVFTQIMINKIK